MKAIIAINAAGYIGDKGGLLWSCKADLAHFKEATLHKRLLVGYNTAKTLPALENRTLVVDKREGLSASQIGAIDYCIGGRKTYERYQSHFTELHISVIVDSYQIGDTPAPCLNRIPSFCKIHFYFFSALRNVALDEAYIAGHYPTIKDEILCLVKK